MDGGLEGQSTGTITVAALTTSGNTSSIWTVSANSGCAINSSGARTGSKFLTFAIPNTASSRRLHSPTTTNQNAINGGNYTIQFYYKTNSSISNLNAVASSDAAVSTAFGTTSAISGINSSSWSLSQTTVTAGSTGKYGMSIIRYQTNATSQSIDIDDFVIYSGSPDITAPDPSLNFSATPSFNQNTISWSAPVTGVDGGGYMVVRYASDPSILPQPSPNQNGIYAIGNSIGSGTVVYLGTNTSFTDTSLSQTTTYYYRIYTVDKAFNYSSPLIGNSTTTRRTISSVSSGGWASASTWDLNVVPTPSDNVVINNGHVITFTGISANSCYNLTINSGGQLYNVTGAPTYTSGYIGIYGTSIVVNGTFGDAVTEYVTNIQFNQNCTLSGNGTIRINRIRPYATAIANATFIFDADANLSNSTGVTMMCENGNVNPVGYKINSGRTVTSLGSFTGGSSSSTNASNGFTLQVDGTLNINSNIYLNAAPGKTASLIVNGLLNIKTFSGSNTAGGGAIPSVIVNSTGQINITGTNASADFSNPTTSTSISGLGTFTLTSGATLSTGFPDGLNPTSGPIRCSNRNFSTEANYTFNGSSAQVTGSDLPSTINRLTVNNVSGVTLSNPTAIVDRLIMTTGQLNTLDQLTLKSSDLKTAIVPEITNPLQTSINGKVTVERYVPAKRAWRLLTAPLKGSTLTTIPNNWQGVSNEGLLLFSPSTYQSQSMLGYVTGGSSPNIWKYNNGWQSIPNLSSEDLFTVSGNNSFLVFATGPYGSNAITNTSLPELTTLKPKGELMLGDYSVNVTPNQYNLIGNPYASPINPVSLKTSNPDFTFWLLDPTLGSYGGYYAFDGTNWTPTTPNDSAGQPDNTNIQSGQAFFVKSATATSFVFSESNKIIGNSNTWFVRNQNSTLVDKIRILLYKQIDGEWQLADGILTVNGADGNDQIDNIDVLKMANFNDNIAFKNGNSNVSIEYRGLPNPSTVQPLKLTGTLSQEYQFRVKTENYSNSNLQPYLQDTESGLLIPIPVDGSELIIPFSGLTSTNSNPDYRFRIVYSSALNSDENNQLQVNLYPNPVEDDVFNILLPFEGEIASYTLTNLIGQEVQNGILDNLLSKVTVSSLQRGVYLLQVKQLGKIYTTKLIIK